MSDTAPAATSKNMENHFFRASAEDFRKIPGSPIAYWLTKLMRNVFEEFPPFHAAIKVTGGMTTADNDKFLRLWWEVSIYNSNFCAMNRESAKESKKKWFPYNKGGGYRKWFGNREYLVNWLNDGENILETGRAYPRSREYYFKESLSYSATSSSYFGIRYSDPGFIFDAKGSSCFAENKILKIGLGFLASKIASHLLKFINPTIEFQTGNISILPFNVRFESVDIVSKLILISRQDWDAYETSWDFTTHPLLHPDHHHPTLAQTYADLRAQWQDTTLEMQRLEEENNRIFIDAYGLQEELTPDVPLEEITLTCNPRYRYGRGKTDEDYDTLLRCDTVKELISYAIGCMMGRYSLDEPGLVYAHSGNQGFDPDRYQTFPADADGILPVMDMDWFEDDATRRLSAFIQCVWPEQHLDDNLSYMADCLSPRAAESPLDTIRRYLSTTFFKDHMRTYKKRPIYWLFSSGRQKAFTCLVYLHRYHPATLSRMRSHYVTPLQGKLAARMEFLDHERQAAGTPSAQKKIQTQMDLLKKKQAELNVFDDELRHYADMKIDLDLDDGVKVNYAKFGNLLAERKGITGK